MSLEARIPELLASGWWYCLCSRGRGCARGRRLNAPDLRRCEACSSEHPGGV